MELIGIVTKVISLFDRACPTFKPGKHRIVLCHNFSPEFSDSRNLTEENAFFSFRLLLCFVLNGLDFLGICCFILHRLD